MPTETTSPEQPPKETNPQDYSDLPQGVPGSIQSSLAPIQQSEDVKNDDGVIPGELIASQDQEGHQANESLSRITISADEIESQANESPLRITISVDEIESQANESPSRMTISADEIESQADESPSRITNPADVYVGPIRVPYQQTAWAKAGMEELLNERPNLRGLDFRKPYPRPIQKEQPGLPPTNHPTPITRNSDLPPKSTHPWLYPDFPQVEPGSIIKAIIRSRKANYVPRRPTVPVQLQQSCRPSLNRRGPVNLEPPENQGPQLPTQNTISELTTQEFPEKPTTPEPQQVSKQKLSEQTSSSEPQQVPNETRQQKL